MNLNGWKTVSGLLFTLAVAVVGGAGSGAELGCSASSGTGSSSGGSSGSSSGIVAPAGCNADASVSCTTGAYGFSCAAGDNPEVEDPTLSCSTPTISGSEDLYCCYAGGTWSSTTCEPNDTLTAVCPDPTSYGYVCASGDDPTSYDASLNCSTPTPDADGVHDDFCCTYAGSSSSSSGVASPPAAPWTPRSPARPARPATPAPSAATPRPRIPRLSCSTPALAAGEDDYCCYSGGTWSTTTCEPDDTLTSVCPDPTSYGYICASGDDPTSYDSSLTCSSPTPDADGVHDDFCCTYQ